MFSVKLIVRRDFDFRAGPATIAINGGEGLCELLRQQQTTLLQQKYLALLRVHTLG